MTQWSPALRCDRLHWRWHQELLFAARCGWILWNDWICDMTWNLGSYLFTNRDRFLNEMRTLPDIIEVFTTASCFLNLNSKQLIPQSQRKPCACRKIPNFRAINFDRFVNLDLQDVRLHFEINWNLQDLSSLPWPRPMKTRAGISQVSSPNRDKRKTRLYI